MKIIRNLLTAIVLILEISFVNAQANPSSTRIIEADLNQVKGSTSKVWRKCVGAGRANEGLRADWQEQLRLTKKELGFEYIRMHGLLNDDMGVYFEDKKGNSIYNWQYIDVLFDFLVSIEVRPFVEIGFMPSALASGKQTIFWWKGNVTPPKSHDKWYAFIKAMTEHYTERYGKEEVRKWYFEVWNEPNLSGFFSGKMEDYFKLYDTTVKAIKDVDATYRVGGPATAGNGWITEMIDHCVDNKQPIDFISTHSYGARQGYLDAEGTKGTKMSPNALIIAKDAAETKNKIQSSRLPKLDLHYTEWSTCYTPTDPIHDTYHSAAYILANLKGTESIASSMSYWVFTDIFEENGPRYSPFHGGFGLLNYQAIKKPAYFAYQFLNNLGDTELKNADKDSWVTKNERGDIKSLFWNCTMTFPTDTVSNQIYYKRDLPAKDLSSTEIKFKNVKPGKYTLKVTKVGYKSNDAYATYLELGSPMQLTKANVKTIKEANTGKPFITKTVMIYSNKTFSIQLPMRENDVLFVDLVKQ
jgi:xylan 1,4-beta-xylosidase